VKKITIIIPALNEEKGIGPVIREIPIKKLNDMEYTVEVMVIDNGSKDKTPRIAREHGARVIVQPVRGYGNAYKAGFANATGDVIATGDADLTYPFTDLPKILRKMEREGLEFINTNRLKFVDPTVMTPSHIFGNWLLTTITKILFNLPFVDSQSGMWIFKSYIWEYLDVRSSGMPFSQELKIEAYIKGFKCAEVPVRYRARAGETKLNTFKDGSKVMLQMFQKKFTTLFSTPARKPKTQIAVE